MRTYIMHKFESAPVIIGIVFISFFVAALLVSADWAAPLATPPTCVTGNPGCDPPVNTGGAGQVKTGGLTVASQPVTGGIGFTVLNGRVGIGTAAPGSKLQVVGDIRSERVGVPSQFMYLECGGGTCFIKSSATEPIAFAPAGSEKMTITTAGNVGIGTPSPSRQLQVTGGGNALFERTTPGYGEIGLRASGYTNDWRLLWADSTGSGGLSPSDSFQIWRGLLSVMSLNSNGNVGIGTTNPTEKLHVNGNITATKVFNPVYAP